MLIIKNHSANFPLNKISCLTVAYASCIELYDIFQMDGATEDKLHETQKASRK